MILIPKYLKRSVAVLLLVGSTYPNGRACGDLRIPSTHFEGVNEEGCVSRWSQLGALNLGDIQVPVITGFQTYKNYISPELGSGWILPLLDANIVQRDEGTFDMVQPDGWRVHFWRDANNPNVLHGSNLGLAEIQGSTITVNSTCGSGWKMVFTQGKLTTLSKGGHTLTIQRDQLGRGIAVRDGITPVMTLEQDQATGLAKSILIRDQKYQLSYDGKPRVENVGGQNLVGGVEPSLHQISYPDGKKETFDFAVTEKMLPNLKITGTDGKERMIVWGLDGKILQDGEWSYDIKQGSDPRGYAAIGRTNTQKQKEYWFSDDENGKETTVALDGTKMERTWFTSGPAHGKIRKIVQIAGGVKKIVRQCSYDEKGRLVREIGRDGKQEIITYDRGNRISSSNPILSPEELDRIERTWKATIELGTEDDLKKQDAIYGLALFYIGRCHDSAKARSLAKLITNQQRRFNVILQSYDHDTALKPENKIYNFQKLLQDFPDKSKTINELIDLRKEEI